MAAPRRVVIVGGGAAGAELACALGRQSAKAGLAVRLVDRDTSHVWKPRLHKLAAGHIGDATAALPYVALARANGFQFELGEMSGFDPAARTVSVGEVRNREDGLLLRARTLPYDVLVLAYGSTANDFGTPGALQHCHMLDTRHDAMEFQRDLLDWTIKVADGAAERLCIGIVGAGATGVELSAELQESVSAMHQLGLMPTDKLQVTLMDMADRVLPQTHPDTSAFAARALERLGIRLRLKAKVEQVTEHAFHLADGETVAADLKVWASGVIGPSFAENLPGLRLDRSRRIVCDAYLRCAGTEGIYALGDCASVPDPKTGAPAPATAQAAHQQAAWFTSRLLHGLEAKPEGKPFTYRSRGTLVSLGEEPTTGEVKLQDRKAVTFSGIVPKLAYFSLDASHRASLIGWRRSATLIVADGLRRAVSPPVKVDW